MAEAHLRIPCRHRRTDKTLTFETGKLAGQADGAVTVRLGDTVVLVTANAAKAVREGIDFFPLTVDVEERMYAAGKIPGSFFRREGKASDQAILTCRLIDRPLRPCFPDGFRNEIHVVGTVLGADLVNPHDVVAINGASAALSLSGIPFDGPIGAVRVAFSTDGEWIPHPDLRGGRRVDLRARRRRPSARRRRRRHHDGRGRRHRGGLARLRGRRPQGDRRGHRRGPRGVQDLDPRVDRGPARAGRGGRRPQARRWPSARPADYCAEVFEAVAEVGADRVAKAESIADKAERIAAEGEARDAIVAELADRFAEVLDAEKQIKAAVPVADQDRSCASASSKRASASTVAAPRDIRPLSAEVGVLPTRARLRPVPAGRDPGAQRHHPRHAAHGADARHPRHRRPQALHAPLQHPALLAPVRPASCAARSAARSATACWPSGPCCRCCRPRRSSPTRSASSPTCCRPTAPRRWGRSAARPCR